MLLKYFRIEYIVSNAFVLQRFVIPAPICNLFAKFEIPKATPICNPSCPNL